MINLGFYSGKKMPNVYLELTIVDRILEGLTVLFTAAAWVIAIVFYFSLASRPDRLFYAPIGMTVFVVIFLWASRAPIRFYNFPVKLNELNYMMQYFIATRFARVVNLIGCLLFFCGLFIDLESISGATSGVFTILLHVVLGFFLLSFVGYYILAFRRR